MIRNVTMAESRIRTTQGTLHGSKLANVALVSVALLCRSDTSRTAAIVPLTFANAVDRDMFFDVASSEHASTFQRTGHSIEWTFRL